VTWRDNQIAQEAIQTRREVLPLGAVFDSDGTLFFPMGDVYQCRLSDGALEGGRCLPLSTDVVFTAGASPSTLGARSIAVSKKMIYVYVNRLGGSGEGYMVRFHKLDQLRSFTNHDDYETIVTICSKALASIEVLQKEVSGLPELCASANGRHVLMQCNRKWFVITDDGQPVSLSPVKVDGHTIEIADETPAPTVEAAPEPAKQTPAPTPASLFDISPPIFKVPKATNDWHVGLLPGLVGLEWIFADQRRAWLSVAVRDGDQFKKDGYNPSLTHIVSDYKPVVHKLPDGRWEIVFKDIK
jgi:hypothetical protein